MSIFQAIVLGILQGLTEFLPVSSSGHLVIVPAILGWPQPSLAFAVAVHVGTLVAVILYYRREWLRLLGATWGWLRAPRGTRLSGEAAVVPLLLLATVPAGIVGLTLADPVEKLFNNPALVAVALLGTGLVLLVGQKMTREGGRSGDVTPAQALLIGIGQAVAVIPGLSRSGMTISTGLLVGLEKDWAARFAFLLSVPVIAGAGVKEGLDLLAARISSGEWCLLTWGLMASAVSGLLGIHAVVRLVHGRRLWWFAVYCAVVGVFTLGALASGLLR